MLRSLTVAAIALLLLTSARPKAHYETVSIAKEEHKLNSGGRMGGVTRQLITLTLPPGTEYVYYSITTSPKGALQDMALHTQLHKKVTEGGFSMSIASSILNELLVPQGDGVSDVLVMTDAQDAQKFINKQDKNLMGLAQYSRTNMSSGTVGIPIDYAFTEQTIYLGLRNPSVINAQFVSVEAVAIIKKL